jgi:hypothetical protein
MSRDPQKPLSYAGLNSLDWMSRFAARMSLLRPDIHARRVAAMAIVACSDFRELSPERAAAIVAQREALD